MFVLNDEDKWGRHLGTFKIVRYHESGRWNTHLWLDATPENVEEWSISCVCSLHISLRSVDLVPKKTNWNSIADNWQIDALKTIPLDGDIDTIYLDHINIGGFVCKESFITVRQTRP